jgi:hypothetical protein
MNLPLTNIPLDGLRLIHPLFVPRQDLNPWQWAEKNVDFSHAQNYDTPIHGPYDPEYMPYWKLPVEWAVDPNVREIVCLKCTRAGGSENIFLNLIRFAVALRPQPTLYLTGDQLTAERFMEKRVKRGMLCAKSTAREYRRAQATQHDIAFPAMDFRVAWPRAKQTWKQDGWAMVLFDELSMAPDGAQEQARRRVDSYPFPHIVWLSSMDPANGRPPDEDPILQEYEDSDRCVWMMPDPVTGNLFEFTFAGIKWPESAKDGGEWDLRRVEAEAYYQTPDGTRIDESARLAVMRTGDWVATNKDPTPKKRGVKVVAPMVPFNAGAFGTLAKEFLLAKEAGALALRSYFYERWAEKFYAQKTSANVSILTDREADYRRGESFAACQALKEFYIGKEIVRLQTIDVQKDSLWYVVREWCGGDSGLVVWDKVSRWETIEQDALKYNVQHIFVDNSYPDRQLEVFHASARIKMFPIYGRALQGVPFLESSKDPETGGKHSPETQILTYTFNPDVFKPIYFDLLTGEGRLKWHVYRNIEREYARQAVAEECVDGVWQARKGYKQNHLFDCEVYQILAAAICGLIKL